MQNVFIGRQPIYDRALNVIGYEVLFRDSAENCARVVDGNRATSQVIIGAFMDMGLDVLVGNRPVFINLTRDFIVGEFPLPFPPGRVVLEVLEDIASDQEVSAGLHRLSQEGYTLALDDYVEQPHLHAFIDQVDIVKVDLVAVGAARLAEVVEALRRHNPRLLLLAEKIENLEEFQRCKLLGFDYFQGYFLSRPNVVATRALPDNRLALLRLLERLQDPETELEQLEALISRDVSLSYRLLHTINSARFAISPKVESIRRAISLIGIRTIRDWASLILLTQLADKPHELFIDALVRARMCENLAAQQQRQHREQYFLVGLFSLLDALMDIPMETILASLPLADNVKNALLSRAGPLGEVLGWTVAFEHGEWERLADQSPTPKQFTDAYLEAVTWGREIGEVTAE